MSVSLSYLDKDYFTTRGCHWGYTHQDSKLYTFKYEQTDTGFKDSTLYFMSGNVVSAAAPDEKGRVDVNDVTALQQYLSEHVTFDNLQKFYADINSDSKIDVRDVTTLQNVLTKK